MLREGYGGGRGLCTARRGGAECGGGAGHGNGRGGDAGEVER